MKDTQKDMLQAVIGKASDLAEATSESFVLAITAAYMAGVEAGKQATLNPTAPAA